jgi:AraC family transcriptional regulator
MKPSASGRILIWRGGSLWIGLAGEPAGTHAHHAVQISLAFPRGAVRLQHSNGGWKSYSAAIVAANVTHAFEARGQHVAQIFVEPESRDGRRLQLQYGKEGIAAISSTALDQQINALATGYQDRAADEALVAGAYTAIATIVGATPAPAGPPDARIALAVDLIRKRLGEAISLGEIADAVHLSPDRFRHLFMEETGVAFRPYLLWQRLECSLAAYVAGQSLTEAAYAGGFADSAHLSRTFKKMFGISPMSVRPE